MKNNRVNQEGDGYAFEENYDKKDKQESNAQGDEDTFEENSAKSYEEEYDAQGEEYAFKYKAYKKDKQEPYLHKKHSMKKETKTKRKNELHMENQVMFQQN